MKRELLDHSRPLDCCPGHDRFPTTTYRNRRSKKARATGKQQEHQTTRAKAKRAVAGLLAS